MKHANLERYHQWMRTQYPLRNIEKAENACYEATWAMIKAFPELQQIEGIVLLSNGRSIHHFWCRLKGRKVMILDPTAHQFLPAQITRYIPPRKAKHDSR